MLTSPSSSLEEQVDQIISCVERRQAVFHASAKIFETPFESGGIEQIGNGACVGGLLTSRELCKLVSISCNSSMSKKKEKKGLGEWNNVNLESLMGLCPMLITHIESASHVDIIGEALNVLDVNGKNDNRNSMSSSTIDSVSVALFTKLHPNFPSLFF